ncbi:MAG: carbohydrate kinase family protein [Hyphomicrobium sp.]|uniref:carbohydrate kinase family protein n=1 Tax=Hyphomicrobium sp. TaxID=82 RepID=UPI003D0DBA7C
MSGAAETHPAKSARAGGGAALKVLTVGGAMIDTIAIIASSAIERMVLLNAEASFLLLEEGRKTEALEVSMHCGGGAINTAVAFARLGLDCAVIAKLGQDRRAEQILAALEGEGISPRWVSRVSSAPTGSSVLVSSHDRNAAVFTFRGANTLLTPQDLADSAFDVDLVYIANLSNEAVDCFPVLIEKAKRAAAKVAANPGIRQLHGRGGAFRAALPQLDILALNRREADEVVPLIDRGHPNGDAPLDFTGGVAAPALAERGFKYESLRMSVRSFCCALLAGGVGTVVLTDGRGGAFAATGNRLFYCPAHEAEVAGTAGAGDAFVATFAAYLAGGAGPDTALRAASVNAASVLGTVDTQTGLLKRTDLEARLGGNGSTPNVIGWTL